jgi:hypothetical protein
VVFAIRNSRGIKAPNLGLLNGKILNEVIKYNQCGAKQPMTKERPLQHRAGGLIHITEKSQLATVRTAYVRVSVTNRGVSIVGGLKSRILKQN